MCVWGGGTVVMVVVVVVYIYEWGGKSCGYLLLSFSILSQLDVVRRY
jgi:hypothetical protein